MFKKLTETQPLRDLIKRNFYRRFLIDCFLLDGDNLVSAESPAGQEISLGLGLGNMLFVYGHVIKDGNRWRLRFHAEGLNATLFQQLKGRVITVSIPVLGIAWSATLAYRRGGGYYYVTVPSRLAPFFKALWLSDMKIPVVVTVPVQLR